MTDFLVNYPTAGGVPGTFTTGPVGGALQDAYVELIRGSVVVILALLAYVAKRVHDLPVKKPVAVATVERTAWNDLRITEELGHLRAATGATRAYLSRFHNGEYFSGDKKLLKKTRTHEAVRDGVAYQAEHFRGMLISTVADEMALIVEDGPSFRPVRELPASKFKWLCVAGGAAAVARVKVCKGGECVGFLGLDFDSEREPKNIGLLVEYAGRIERYV